MGKVLAIRRLAVASRLPISAWGKSRISRYGGIQYNKPKPLNGRNQTMGNVMYRLLCLALLMPIVASAQEVPIADFARNVEIKNIQISPDGKYLAEVRLVDGDDYLAIIRMSDKKTTNALKMDKDQRVADYWWVGKERVVVSFAEQLGPFVQPVLTGELLAMDADGTGGAAPQYLYGYRGARHSLGSRIQTIPDADYRYAHVIRTLPKDGHEAVIEINDFGGVDHPGRGFIERIDVYTGKRNAVSAGPARGHTAFLVDWEGNARYAVAVDDHFKYLTYSKSSPKDDWKLLNGDEAQNFQIFPIEISSDSKRVFLRSDEGGSQLCLIEQNLEDGSRRKLSCDDSTSVSGAILSFDHKDVIAARYLGAPPWERLLESTHPDAAKLKALQDAFPGQIVMPISATDDASKVVISVYSDRNPGDYYLFDPKSSKADYLASRRSWIDPEQMSEQRAIVYRARDGQQIHGILTLPRNRGDKNLPLVVNPHGGSFYNLDTWGWESDTQLLASRGYAVLQVNFRGSGGYGQDFVDAGRQNWDSVMVDDITDGTRWAIKQGIAAADRICIYGASYGGYAALMSAVREPDLYRCTIGYAGVYDMNLWKSETNATESRRGRTFFDAFVGSSSEKLKAASPLTYIDRLKAAVMIVHGKDDTNVPISQAEALRKALDARNYPYEWLIKPNEGHGFYEPKNREELYQKMLAFLDRNIGTGAVQAKQTAATDAVKEPAAAALP